MTLGSGADQHDRKRAGLVSRPDALGGLESIHARQHPVEHHEAEGIASSSPIATLQQRKPIFDDGHGHRRNRPAPEKRLEQLAARRGVFHDQHRQSRNGFGCDTRWALELSLDAEARGKEEGRAGAGNAVDCPQPSDCGR
jgi:hypothetical protein